MIYRALGLLLTTIVAIPSAYAMGPCEDVSTRYALAAVSEKSGELLVRGTAKWCEFEEEEVRGALGFAQIRDTTGKIIAWFIQQEGAKAVQRLEDNTVAKNVKPWSALKVRREKGGFVAAKTLQTSPNGLCSSRVVWSANPEADELGFKNHKGVLEIRAGAQIVHKIELGDASIDWSAPDIHALFLPKKKTILVWTSLPTCVGGPPPGYGGDSNFAGICYFSTTEKIQLLTVRDEKKLARCFSREAAQ